MHLPGLTALFHRSQVLAWSSLLYFLITGWWMLSIKANVRRVAIYPNNIEQSEVSLYLPSTIYPP